MNIDKNNYITPEEYDKLQLSYDCTTEYFDGEIWLNSNASDKHNDIIINIASEVRAYLKNSQCKVKTKGMEVIFDENEKYKFKPDVFIVCKNDIDAMKGESYTTPPKVIFEVVSLGKEANIRDKRIKYDIYEQYGVLEYNIVEQNGFITQHKLIDGNYQIVDMYKKDDEFTSTVYTDLKIYLKDIF